MVYEYRLTSPLLLERFLGSVSRKINPEAFSCWVWRELNSQVSATGCFVSFKTMKNKFLEKQPENK